MQQQPSLWHGAIERTIYDGWLGLPRKGSLQLPDVDVMCGIIRSDPDSRDLSGKRRLRAVPNVPHGGSFVGKLHEV